MRRLSLFWVLASAPAWAVGEHIAVTGPAREQLRETLCISMECGPGASDYTVTSKLVGEQMELKVLGPNGTVRFTLMTPTSGAGKLSASDAMNASTRLVHAIENPNEAKAKVTASKVTKKSVKLAKRPSRAPFKVASRMRARG